MKLKYVFPVRNKYNKYKLLNYKINKIFSGVYVGTYCERVIYKVINVNYQY